MYSNRMIRQGFENCYYVPVMVNSHLPNVHFNYFTSAPAKTLRVENEGFPVSECYDTAVKTERSKPNTSSDNAPFNMTFRPVDCDYQYINVPSTSNLSMGQNFPEASASIVFSPTEGREETSQNYVGKSQNFASLQISDEELAAHQCKLCCQYFVYTSDLNKHLDMHISNTWLSTSTDQPINCSYGETDYSNYFQSTSTNSSLNDEIHDCIGSSSTTCLNDHGSSHASEASCSFLQNGSPNRETEINFQAQKVLPEISLYGSHLPEIPKVKQETFYDIPNTATNLDELERNSINSESASSLVPNGGSSNEHEQNEIKAEILESVDNNQTEEKAFEIEGVEKTDSISSVKSLTKQEFEETYAKPVEVHSTQIPNENQQHLSEFNSDLPKITEFPCNLCPETFKEQNSLEIHLKCHVEMEPYECIFCYKRFRKPSMLSSHEAGHYVRQTKYQCDFCERSYISKRCFDTHRLLHKGEKPYKEAGHYGREEKYQCDLCERSYFSKRCFDTHRLLHKGEKPHKCDICGKLFARIVEAKMHLKSHSNERPFACQCCPKTFKTKYNLIRHSKTHM